MKNLLASLLFKKILFAIIVIAAVFFIFGLGVSVGYHKASFSSSMRENYYNDFYGPPPKNFLDGMPPPISSHGIAGSVIDVSDSVIAVKDFNNNEQSVQIMPDTVIRKMGDTITAADVDIGDRIAVIGAPGPTGRIEGRFIRVFGSSSSLPNPNF